MKTILIILSLLPAISSAAVQKLSAVGGNVEIVAKGRPNFLRVIGHGDAPEGSLFVDGEKVSGKLEFELASLKTGIDTRDKHMKERYLEVEKFPKATLEIQKVSNLAKWDLKKPVLQDQTFAGQLTLHGVTKPVSGKFTMSESRAVEATFTVKLSDFAVGVPQFGGITIADDVEVNVKIADLTVKKN